MAKYLVRRRWTDGYVWDWMSLDLSHEPFNELEIFKKGDIFIDCGAFAGRWTIPSSPYYHGVVAVEAYPPSAKVLRHNLHLNNIKNVDVIEMAVLDYEGETVFYKYPGPMSNSVLKNHMETSGLEQVRVPCTTIDRITSRLTGRVSLIKLDVEGVELNALRGATETIKRDHPKLLVECHLPSLEDMIPSYYPDYSWRRNYRVLPEGKRQVHLVGESTDSLFNK